MYDIVLCNQKYLLLSNMDENGLYFKQNQEKRVRDTDMKFYFNLDQCHFQTKVDKITQKNKHIG